jgi:hypothetical protein
MKRQPPRSPEVFPDPNTCRTTPTDIPDTFLCHGMWGSHCCYSIVFESRHYCRHSTAAHLAQPPHLPPSR